MQLVVVPSTETSTAALQLVTALPFVVVASSGYLGVRSFGTQRTTDVIPGIGPRLASPSSLRHNYTTQHQDTC